MGNSMYDYDRRSSLNPKIPILSRQIEELIAQFAGSIPRGSGPYGTFLPGEATPEVKEAKLRLNGARQAQAWCNAAREMQTMHHAPDEDPGVVAKLDRAVEWYKWATASRLTKKEPKRWPKLRWDEIIGTGQV